MQYLIEQTTSNGTILALVKKAPQRSSTLYVFQVNDSLLATFLAHTKERPGALDPINKTFVANLTTLLRIFPTEKSLWFLDYLMDIMPLNADVSSNTINGWIVGIENYNNSQPNPNLKITKEIEYLTSLRARAHTIFENKLTTKNKKALEEEMTLIDKVTPGAPVPIVTPIEMDPTLRGKLAEAIGKKYDAHLMRSSKTNEDKLYSFFLHEGVHEWITRVSPSTAGRPELAARLSKGAIILILNEAKVPIVNNSSMTIQEVVAQVANGDVSIGELDSRMRERALVYIKDNDILIPNVKNSFYQILYRTLETIAKKCKTTLLSQDSDGGNLWQAKLNTLATEVESQIRSPNNATVKKIANAVSTCFISESDYKLSKEMENASIKSEKTSFRLDDWQNALVESILTGESVIAVGPTSGGKTLTSMVALDRLFRQDKEKTLIYVAPNFYQALQAYCSMVKSFPKQTFGLITGSINISPRDCKYWVGTPEHLWTFARAGDMKFNIGIIDEIHTISSPDTTTLENKRKAVCLGKLIGLIKNQFVGLSATIHPDDEEKLASHVEKILLDSGVKLKVEFGLGGNKIKRFIPLVNEVFTGEDILPVAEAKTNKTIRVTPENTFNLMKMLSDKQMTPSLIFDMDEKASYTLFSSLVKYLSDRHQNEYVTWRNINNNFEKDITAINKEILTNPEGDKYERLRQKRNSLIVGIIAYISTQIRLALDIKEVIVVEAGNEESVKIWPGSTRPRRKRVVIEEDETKEASKETSTNNSKSVAGLNMVEVDESLRIMAPSLTTGQPFTLPSMIPQEVSDLYGELRILKLELSKAELRPIPEICSGIGSYFNFGKKRKNDVFRQLYNHDKSQITKEDETTYNMIAALSDAEGVKFDDVKQIFKLMDVALSFGIGILIPTMPFCVQFQIMKMLNEGDITIVFASESLSMGVNFPARSCVVRTLQNGTADITKVLQMGGRAGRRGVSSDGKQDKEAYSITWNVSNASDIDQAQKNSSTMPRLVLDLENIKDRGAEVIVKNHKTTAMEINIVMNTAASVEDLKIATEKLEKTTARLGRGKKFISEEDENKMAAKEAVGKKSKIETYEEDEEEETKSVKTVKKETFTKDSSVVTSIEKCVTILGRDLSFSSDTISKLNKRVGYIKSEVVNAEMLDEPYEWAERINLVKQALQEVHTGLHTRKCTALLNYISVLYKLIHRISMKYIGLVYQKDSTRSI